MATPMATPTEWGHVDTDPQPTITDFLLAKVAEDEANADLYLIPFPEEVIAPLFRRLVDEGAAKRAIIEEHSPVGSPAECATCGDWEHEYYDGVPHKAFPCPTIRSLAAVYADYPGYREEWSLNG